MFQIQLNMTIHALESPTIGRAFLKIVKTLQRVGQIPSCPVLSSALVIISVE